MALHGASQVGRQAVPEAIFKANRPDLLAFLAAYFNCDGTVWKQGAGGAEFYSTSEGLLRDVQQLLTRLGIYSMLRPKLGKYKGEPHHSWRLAITTAEDLIRLANLLPAIGQRGEDLRAQADKARLKPHTQAQYAAIPNGWQKLCRWPMSRHRFQTGVRVDKEYKLGAARHLVQRIAEAEDNDELRKLCREDLWWERIVKIEDMGSGPTYDLEVANTHNFVANGIIVHNSTQVSRMFPAWWLGKRPEEHIILTSYAASLAFGFSRHARNLLKSNSYRACFGNLASVDVPVELAVDSRSVQEWRLAASLGGVVAAGVGGGITGKSAHLAIIDDPLKGDDWARSELIRDGQKDWYSGDLYTRLAPDGVVIICMTRWNVYDLAGWLLKEQLLAATCGTCCGCRLSPRAGAELREWCERNFVTPDRYLVARRGPTGPVRAEPWRAAGPVAA